MEAGIDLPAPEEAQLRGHLKRARNPAQAGPAEVRRTLQASREVEELESLFRAEQTAKSHVSIIYSKLGAHDRVQALRFALEAGFDLHEG